MSNEGHETNRKLWNEIAQVHYDHPNYRVKEFLQGWSNLKTIELEGVGDVRGKELLHLMCQFALDTLCWARLGAKVTGVDISDKSIELAHHLKQEAGLAGEFIRCDVLELIGRIDREFDVIYQSYGTLCWISDLAKWGQVVAHYLKPGGFFFLVDGHPIWPLFGWPQEGISYFAAEPQRYSGDPDYCDRNYIPKNDSVEWQHPMSRIIMALIRAGLTIESFEEYDKGYYAVEKDWYKEGDFWYPPGGPTKYPLMFSLKVRKPA